MTDFEKKVLKIVSKIPLGETRSYKWVAIKAGKPKAYRAVANALHKNPFPVFIPCHRVIPFSRIPRAAPVDNQGAGRRPTGRIARYHGFYPWGSSMYCAAVGKY